MRRASDTKTLRAVIGEQLKQLREDLGDSQEGLAEVARLGGLDWTRSTVAAVETGRREVPLMELLLLARIFAVPVASFVEGDGWISDSPAAAVSRRAARAELLGDTSKRTRRDWDTPGSRAEEAILELEREIYHQHEWLWPAATEEELQEAGTSSSGHTEQAVAKKFGVSPFVVVLASYGRWHRSLTAERDRQVARRVDAGADRRTIQAVRGHVTRGLVNEIAADLRKANELERHPVPTVDEIIAKHPMTRGTSLPTKAELERELEAHARVDAAMSDEEN